ESPRNARKRPRRAAFPFTPVARRARSDLAHHEEDEDQRVDDQRLDEREAENHRDEDLVRGARVASDAVERGRRGADLTETTAEGGEAEADAGGDGDPAALRGGGDGERAVVGER